MLASDWIFGVATYCPVVVPYQNLTLAINWCSSRLWHSFRISTPDHRFPHANDTQSKNIFRCLPRARLPSIFPVNTIASSSFFLNTCHVGFGDCQPSVNPLEQPEFLYTSLFTINGRKKVLCTIFVMTNWVTSDGCIITSVQRLHNT